MRLLSARSDIFVQSSLGLALALKALLVAWLDEYFGEADVVYGYEQFCFRILMSEMFADEW